MERIDIRLLDIRPIQMEVYRCLREAARDYEQVCSMRYPLYDLTGDTYMVIYLEGKKLSRDELRELLDSLEFPIVMYDSTPYGDSYRNTILIYGSGRLYYDLIETDRREHSHQVIRTYVSDWYTCNTA